MAQPVAMVLAAGLGTRLRPATDRIPKPLIPVAGVEPLFYALFSLREQGFRRFVVNVHHLPRLVVEALRSWQALLPDIEVRISHKDKEILGTGGGLLKVVRESHDWLSQSSGLLVYNGDTIADFNLSQLMKAKNAVMGVSYDKAFFESFGGIEVNEQDHWCGLIKISQMPEFLQNTDLHHHRPAHFFGIHFLGTDAIQSLQNEAAKSFVYSDLFNGVYQVLGNLEQKVSCVEIGELENRPKGFWFDIGSSENMLKAQRFLMSPKVVDSVWRKVLKARYPNLLETQPTVFRVGANTNGSISQSAPSLYVGVGEGRDLKLGPFTCLVASGTQPISLNALEDCVLVARKESQDMAPLRGDVRGQVLVV